MKAEAQARRARLGLRLTLYALGGSVAGILGFGLIWAGFAGRQWVAVPFGLVLLLAGLDRAGTALAASMLARRAGRSDPATGPSNTSPRTP